MTPRRRWGTPTDASVVTAAHRCMSSATRSNDDIERLSVHLYVGRWSSLDAIDENSALVGADFHAAFSCCFIQSLSELLQSLFTASEQIDVIGKLLKLLALAALEQIKISHLRNV